MPVQRLDDGEKREIADMGPTSKWVNGHARVDEALPLLYLTQVLYKIKLWDKANNRSFFQAINLCFVVQVASSNLFFQIC